MDEDTRNFLQHIYESLDRKISDVQEQIAAEFKNVIGQLADVNARLDRVEGRIAGLSSSMLNYANHVEALRSEFSAAHEHRLPPEAAA